MTSKYEDIGGRADTGLLGGLWFVSPYRARPSTSRRRAGWLASWL